MLAIHKSAVDKEFYRDHCHEDKRCTCDDPRDFEANEAEVDENNPEDSDPVLAQLANQFLVQFLLQSRLRGIGSL